MNSHLSAQHPSVHFYDSDYPSTELEADLVNVDDTVAAQGLAHDIQRYLALAAEAPAGPVLELACGTGRVAIPLARSGHEVVGVDCTATMLDKFRSKLALEADEVQDRVTLHLADATSLSLPEVSAGLIVVAFNGLMCIPAFDAQVALLETAARHLHPAGRVALDLMNPLELPLCGSDGPRPFFTRKHTDTGRSYTRFAAMGPMDTEQVQELFGWYDETTEEGFIRRTPYSMHWRPIFRYELELMCERAGLTIESVEGGHRREPFVTSSNKMFVVARRTG